MINGKSLSSFEILNWSESTLFIWGTLNDKNWTFNIEKWNYTFVRGKISRSWRFSKFWENVEYVRFDFWTYVSAQKYYTYICFKSRKICATKNLQNVVDCKIYMYNWKNLLHEMLNIWNKMFSKIFERNWSKTRSQDIFLFFSN